MPLTININGDFLLCAELESLLRLRPIPWKKKKIIRSLQNWMKWYRHILDYPTQRRRPNFFFPFLRSLPFTSLTHKWYCTGNHWNNTRTLSKLISIDDTWHLVGVTIGVKNLSNNLIAFHSLPQHACGYFLFSTAFRFNNKNTILHGVKSIEKSLLNILFKENKLDFNTREREVPDGMAYRKNP